MTWRVLVVDDEPAVRHALERSLRYFGYEVVSVAGGDSAYDILQHDRFDIVLLDIHMPLMSGDTLFLAIIRRWPKLHDRTILMSGDPETATEGWSAELKRCPYLVKPFTLETLTRCLATMLESTKQPQSRFGNDA